MGAPASGLKAAAEDSSAEVLLSKFHGLSAAERRRHATVYNYWLSIRGDRQFPPIRDLDPLEISDAGPCSLLLELIGGGEDAEVRHLGQTLKEGPKLERIGEAASPSLLSCIAAQLPVVANVRQAIAFEDEYPSAEGVTRASVTLLPFSSTGTYVDYVYGFVSLEPIEGAAEEAIEDDATGAVEALSEVTEEALAPVEEDILEAEPETLDAEEEQVVEDAPEPSNEPEQLSGEPVDHVSAEQAYDDEHAVIEDEVDEPAPAASSEKRPGFSKFFDALAGVGGFYGNVIQMDPKVAAGTEEEQGLEERFEEEQLDEELEHAEIDDQLSDDDFEDAEVDHELLDENSEREEAAVEESVQAESPHEEPTVDEVLVPEDQEEVVESHNEPKSVPEGHMQTRLAEVRGMADEARMAKLRANVALYEGLGAAYDFALDAEENAEDYLKLVEAQGLKIQLRSPMKPVVKLAFEGMCDDATIAQLETVLAWALKQDLPRGTLAERIEAEGGIGAILNGKAAA